MDPRGYVDHDDAKALAGCGGIVWGRTGFDQGFDGGWETWPWPNDSEPTTKPASSRAILVGSGVPLFDLHLTEYSSTAWAATADRPAPRSLTQPIQQLELRSQRPFEDGVVELVYAPVTDQRQ